MTANVMAALLPVFAALAVGGATMAVSARDARLAVLGLLVALLAAPFVASPLPDARGIAARLAGAVLATYPLLIAVRGEVDRPSGSRAGWPSEVLLALTAVLAGGAAAAGWKAAGDLGPSASIHTTLLLPAIASGVAMIVLATGPVLLARDPLRLTLGLCLGVLGMNLLDAGMVSPTPLGGLVAALLIAAVAISGAVVIRGARRPPIPAPVARGVTPVLPSREPAAGRQKSAALQSDREAAATAIDVHDHGAGHARAPAAGDVGRRPPAPTTNPDPA